MKAIKKDKKPVKDNNYKINKLTHDTIAAIKKNEKLFSNVINQNHGFVDSIVLKFVKKNNREYDDLMQVGYMGMWKAINKFNSKRRNVSSFSTFAYTVIRNDVLIELKKINRMNRSVTLWSELSTKDENEHVNETKLKVLHRQNYDFENSIVDQIAYEQKLKQFSNLERNIITLKQDGFTMQQIAEKLNKNISTLKAVYYTAINRFKQVELND